MPIASLDEDMLNRSRSPLVQGRKYCTNTLNLQSSVEPTTRLENRLNFRQLQAARPAGYDAAKSHNVDD